MKIAEATAKLWLILTVIALLQEVHMSKLLRDIPVEKQIAKHMQWFERKRAERQEQTSGARATPLGPYVAISRELGSAGEAVAHLLAEQLHWPVFDREIIEAIAAKTHVREELVAQFDEHVRSALDTYLQNLYTGRLFDASKYLYHLSQVLLGIVQYGQAVILGRGANLILPGARGVRARLVAPREVRVQNLMREHRLVEKQALQMLEAHDREQRDFFQRYFHSQPDEACAYDVIINTGTMGGEHAATLLRQMLALKSGT